MAGKQAKILSEELLQEALAYVEHYTQHPLRNRVMLTKAHNAITFKVYLFAREMLNYRASQAD